MKVVMHRIPFSILFTFLSLLFIFPANKASAANPEHAVPGWAPVSDDSLAVIRREVNSDPTNAGAHARLGSALLSRGDSEEEAIRAFDMALKLNPRNAEAKTGKGIILLRKGDFALAEQLLREALLQSPDPVKIHYELGLLYQKKGSFDQAVAEFKEGISKFQQGRR